MLYNTNMAKGVNKKVLNYRVIIEKNCYIVTFTKVAVPTESARLAVL